MSNSQIKTYEQISDLTPEEFKQLREELITALENSKLTPFLKKEFISTLQVINIFYEKKNWAH